MIELKIYSGEDIQELIEIGDGTDVDYVNKQFVEKTEADKVIADLEESHKMEVEQLLIEIAELKAQKAQAEDDCAYWKMREGNAVNAMHETEEACMFLTKSERHQKYKRCLLMAKICENKLGTVVKPGWWDKWRRRWLELAEKFKETN